MCVSFWSCRCFLAKSESSCWDPFFDTVLSTRANLMGCLTRVGPCRGVLNHCMLGYLVVTGLMPDRPHRYRKCGAVSPEEPAGDRQAPKVGANDWGETYWYHGMGLTVTYELISQTNSSHG